jgi:hypothetical protein
MFTVISCNLYTGHVNRIILKLLPSDSMSIFHILLNGQMVCKNSSVNNFVKEEVCGDRKSKTKMDELNIS